MCLSEGHYASDQFLQRVPAHVNRAPTVTHSTINHQQPGTMQSLTALRLFERIPMPPGPEPYSSAEQDYGSFFTT